MARSKSIRKSNRFGGSNSNNSIYSIYNTELPDNNYLLEDFSNDPFNEMYGEDIDEYDEYDEEELEELETIDTINFACNDVNDTYAVNLNNVEKSNFTINEIDLSKVKTNNENIKSEYFIPGLIKYKDIELPVIKYVSKGSYGYVYEYSSVTPLPENWIEVSDETGTLYRYDDGENMNWQWDRPRISGDKYYAFAVKVYMNPKDTEIRKIENINKSARLGQGFCNTINAIVLELNNNIYNKNVVVSVMDMMDGSLAELRKIKSLGELIIIIKKIAEMLQCIYDKGLIYTDIKLGNVLYKCYDDLKLKLSLGDLGSICTKGRKEAYTYTPPEFFDGGNNCTEPSMVWGLGVLLITLLRINDKLFYHETVKQFPNVETFNKEVKIYINRINNKLGLNDVILSKIDGITDNNITMSDLLNFMLSPDPPSRITLKQVIQVLGDYY